MPVATFKGGQLTTVVKLNSSGPTGELASDFKSNQKDYMAKMSDKSGAHLVGVSQYLGKSQTDMLFALSISSVWIALVESARGKEGLSVGYFHLVGRCERLSKFGFSQS